MSIPNIVNRTKEYLTKITSDDFVTKLLEVHHKGSNDDWEDLDNYCSSDFIFYFDEFYYGRIPGRQPNLTDPEWAIVTTVDQIVTKYDITTFCSNLADELGVDSFKVHQVMIHNLLTYLIDVASTIK